MRYILERSEGYDRILARQPDGTYQAIAICTGEFGSGESQNMIALANINTVAPLAA